MSLHSKLFGSALLSKNNTLPPFIKPVLLITKIFSYSGKLFPFFQNHVTFFVKQQTFHKTILLFPWREERFVPFLKKKSSPNDQMNSICCRFQRTQNDWECIHCHCEVLASWLPLLLFMKPFLYL